MTWLCSKTLKNSLCIINTVCSRKSVPSVHIDVLSKLWKWQIRKSWNVLLLISSEEQRMLGHMLLNDAVSPVIKLDTCITCLRMHCMVHGTARLQGECNSHKIPVETGHTWCCPWSLLLCPWIVPSLTPPPQGCRPYLHVSSSHKETGSQVALWV